ncbi:MAG: peptidoglycan DD-metalloendopeptidase family protein [Actinomycetia bacterium]|nr:peptidoglycan DD-metalloendopeptidase family protein [Actinomycetes bacterium]
MLLTRAPRWLLLLLTIAIMALVPIGASAQTKADVDAAARNKAVAEARKSEAYKHYQEVTASLDDAVARYEALNAQREELTYRISRMEQAVERYQTKATELNAAAQDLVIRAYTSGQSGMIGSAFAANTIEELVTSRALLDRAAEIELASLDNLDAVSRQADRSASELTVQKTDVAASEDAAALVVEETAELQQQQQEILAEANDYLRAAIVKLDREIREKKIEDERRAKEQAERARAASRSKGSSSSSTSTPSTGSAAGASSSATTGFICPVQGRTSFIDSWGYPRSGGRKHKGVDMFATRNTPLVAVVDGRVKLSSNSLGGWTVHLYSDTGTVYYYAHLESQATDIRSGQRVSKGTVVGYVGNSGNARYTSPHVHFEIRPGGRAVNPYPTVRPAC